MRIDLNADLGESFGRWTLGDDAALLRLITSANVACGFHAGDPATLVHTCRDAVATGVRIGAQVGYRDLAGFGRRFIDVAPQDLYADVLYQLGALDGIARSVGAGVEYVKPHGALYNTIVTHEAQAAAVVEAVAAYDSSLPLLGQPGSRSLVIAHDAGLPTVREGFADRGYNADGSLVSRSEEGAVLHDPEQIAQRVVTLVTTGRVVARDGSEIALPVESVCLHGDTPNAAAIAAAVRAALQDAGVDIRSFLDH